MRVSEWVIAVFFAWTTALALSLPISSDMRTRTLIANAVVLLLYIVLLRVQHREWAQTVRDWFPQALMILAYKQMGWFAPQTHTNRFEYKWIVWDRVLLNDMHGRALIEYAGPLLPSLLEFCYALVYAVPPITMLVIYAAGLRKRADTLLTIYLLGLFLCYAQFPFWPSEPPAPYFLGRTCQPYILCYVASTSGLWEVTAYTQACFLALMYPEHLRLRVRLLTCCPNVG